MFVSFLAAGFLGFALGFDTGVVEAKRASFRPEPETVPTERERAAVIHIQEIFLDEVDDIVVAKAEQMGAVSWKEVLRRVPGIIEAVAMYYCLVDPQTPWRVKVDIAMALLYVLTPDDYIPDNDSAGWADDMSVISVAFAQVRDHVMPRHVEQARAFLEAEGLPTTTLPEGDVFAIQA